MLTTYRAVFCRYRKQSVRLLAHRGCNLSKGDTQAVTPVFFAAQEGHTACVSLLLSLGADGGVPRADGASPLIIAAQNGHDSCVTILLSPPPVERSPFVTAARGDGDLTPNGATAIQPTKVPVPPLAGLEHRTSSGYTALCMAVVAGQRQCVEKLLLAGANVDAADRKERSPLYLAAAAGDALMCGVLLANGAQPRRKAINGVEPALAAARRGHASAAQRIVNDARLDATDIIDSAGVPLPKFLGNLEQKRRATGGGGNIGTEARNCPGDKRKRIAPLLPASVARLPAAPTREPVMASSMPTHGRACTTSTSSDSNTKATIAAATAATTTTGPAPTTTTTTGLPHTRIASEQSVKPRRKRNASPPRRVRRVSDEADARPVGHDVPTELAAAAATATATIEATTNRSGAGGAGVSKTKACLKTWSGVHGEEGRSAAAAITTPGRRRPLRMNKNEGDAGLRRGAKTKTPVPMTQHPEEGKKEGNNKHEGHGSLLDRMTAFLFDI